MRWNWKSSWQNIAKGLDKADHRICYLRDTIKAVSVSETQAGLKPRSSNYKASLWQSTAKSKSGVIHDHTHL